MTLPHPRRRLFRALFIGLAVASTAAAFTLPAAAAQPVPVGQIRAAGAAGAIPGSYIVVLKDSSVAVASTASTSAVTTAVTGKAHSLAAAHGATVGYVYSSALRGFQANMSVQSAKELAADSSVSYVEQNQVVTIDATQTNPPSWGLDRIDQRNLPLSSSYTYPNTASNVHAYIIDTGIRFAHTTFGSPSRATSGFDAVDGGSADDGNGHGTHVAGTVGGSAYGVAKGVQLVAVRVLDASGSGTTAGVIAGINWVTTNAIKPAVANMSLGGGASTSLDNAVANSIGSGVTYAVAAGNSNANACNSSPSRVATAITVGATQTNDARASFSNVGSCLDIFAPGVGITSSWNTSNTATNTISGTSMASPHVAGAAALILSANPGFNAAQVSSALVNNATTGVVTSPGTSSPNRLLFVQ
jgi:subtilisin family serine protease